MADTDGWNGPGSADSDGVRQLLAKIDRLNERLAAVERGAPLRSAGISVTEDGMTVDRSLAVAGDLDVTGGAEFSGDTTIGGNASITGTLSLPNGIIDNDALANPLVQQSEQGWEEAFPITTSPVQRASYYIPVPSGFTNAHMIVCATAAIHNTGAVDTYGYLRVYAESPGWSAASARSNVAIPPNHTRTFTALVVRSHNDQPFTDGDQMNFFVEMYGDHALSASVSTWVNIEALLTFTR